MSSGFRELPRGDVTRALEDLLLPRIAAALQARGAGHCLRITDLDPDLMLALARGLKRALPASTVCILGDGAAPAADRELFVSSTKLVELRNPLPDGTLRPPLCVFLPANLRTSAEDSFGAATFEDFDLGDAYRELLKNLLGRLPAPLQGHVRDVLQHVDGQRWRWGGPVAQVRYLLAALANGVDGESLGAALYELGLVPDFRLFDEPSTAFGRARKNLESVRALTESGNSIRGRAANLGLVNRALRRRLGEFLVEHGVEDPVAWARQIALDRKNWDVSFDKWEFASQIAPDKIAIVRVETDLPVVVADEKDEKLVDLIGQQVLAPRDRKKFNVVFEVAPHPAQVQGLDYFSVQIVSKEAGPIGVLRKVKVWTAKRAACTVGFAKLDKVEFDEGWHFIRVLPWTSDEDPIPLEQSDGKTAKRLNESEPFYVLPEAEIQEEPPQRAVPKASSLEHARIERQFTLIHERREPEAVKPESVSWAGHSAHHTAGQETIEVRFGKEGAYQIAVARWLKIVEQRILSSPDRPVSWRMQINLGEPEVPAADVVEWPASASSASFLDARREYFASIRQGNRELVSQGMDFLSERARVVAYASAYEDLLRDLAAKVERQGGTDQQRAIVDLRKALTVDTVRIFIRDYRGQTREAALLGPLHPLRALWHAGWAHLGAAWVKAAHQAAEEWVTPTREALARGIVPLNVPPLLPVSDGKVFAAVDNLRPFWSLYAPATEEDPRGLLGEICAALGLPEPSIGGSIITGEVLASRVERYLAQHPYVRTMTINAFNAGRGAVLAEALTALQANDAFANLRYDIRFFVPDPDAPGVGEAVGQLLSPDSASAGEAFAIPTGSHVFPKLTMAVRSVDDFRTAPVRYRAHISVLFDVFPPEEVAAARPFCSEQAAPLHGLVQDFAIEYRDDEGGTSWKRQPRHGVPLPIDSAEDVTSLLGSLPALLSAATATVARASAAFESRPVITLALDANERALIHQVHEASDWVFTVDRNMGIEFFDHGGRRDRPDYLIDYTPSGVPEHGHRLVISSRSLAELEAILRPVLKQYGLDAEERHALVVLNQLRSLSGRLALKLVSSPTARAEALGLALARLFLQYQGALRNQVVVPLDAHLDLFHAARRQAEEIGDEVTLRRTDLALFDLDFPRRTLTCNLVEVKCYAQRLGLSGYGQLKEVMTEQLNQSERVLQQHFDSERVKPDRPDRLLKTRELATLLGFYLDRSVRYGLMDAVAADEARQFIETLEQSYLLRFTRSALVFDFDKPGTEPPENEVGIEFHRIGRNLIRALVADLEPATESTGADTPGEGGPPPSGAPASPPTSPPVIPRLDSAAFLVRDRPRTNGTASPPSPEEEGPAHGVTSTIAREGAVPAPFEPELLAQPPAAAQSKLGRDTIGALVPVLPQDAAYDVVLGVVDPSPQYGLLGEATGRRVALDLNQTHTISLFGVQGGGKSYTLGTIVEMACMPIPNINELPRPLATVIFHFSSTLDYRPEFTSMVTANTDDAQVKALRERYGAEPRALEDVVILTSAAKVEERASEYPAIKVLPISFRSSELKAAHWKFLMGAVGSHGMYIRQVGLVMRQLREELTLNGLRKGIEDSTLSDHLKELALLRLQFAEEYIDDRRDLTSVLRPGRLVIVDLRDELVDKDEALGLFVVLLQIFAEATYHGQPFNKLVVFDEAHKYVESPDLVAGLVEVVREMRHKGTSILVASQDPPSVPTSLIELSSQIILHKFNSPSWLKHVQRANAALESLTPARLSSLGPGEAYVWSSKATDDAFSKGAVKIRCRPRVTQHGGGTRTAMR